MKNCCDSHVAERPPVPGSWTVAACARGTLPPLFEAQAARTPDAPALVFESTCLSYSQLNARANRIAHGLIADGIGPEDIIALAMPRSPDMVAALLAILKAGAAYLPLDPQYPPQRLAFMLDDAKPARLFTTRELAGALPGGVPAICLDDAAMMATLSKAPVHDPADHERKLPLSSMHPAYVIYTSGSTGRPKGVVVTHTGLASLAASQIDRFAIAAGARVLQFASISFDAAVSELFTTLLSGACLVLAPSARLMPGAPLAALAEETGVTHATLPPSVLAAMPDGSLAGCSTLIVAGEACPPHMLRQWAIGRRMINAYGPTESTVCATMSQPLTADVIPPLGHPIWKSEVYLLDRSLQPVPLNVPGELYIAGAGLARGYLERPGLTAERFIANPFGLPGSRMYRSGDLACRRGDGTLEFLGRIDHQVKIRGFRIEPGEIEAALMALPAVREAVVLAREDDPGDKRLAAYVVMQTDAGAGVDAETLRAALARSLPDYMVPSHFIVLDRLPLTPNGKIDRKALPAPSGSRGETGYAAPRTPAEQALAAIWAEVLRLDRVGIHDNFFALGGHSLLATQVVSKLRIAFQVEVPLQALFDACTIYELAQRIDALRVAEHGISRPAIVPAEAGSLPPLSFAQQRLWFLNQLHPNLPGYYITPYWRHLQGDPDQAALRKALNAVVARHAALRTTYPARDGAPYQSVATQLALELPLTDLSALPAAERESRLRMLLLDEAGTPFDLATGPLIRARLVRTDAQDWLFMLTMHHIVTDGWSLGVLDGELARLYDAFIQDQSDPLPSLTIQTTDFALWQRDYLAGDVLDRLRAYWTQQLKDAPALLQLPIDKPRQAVQTYAKGILPFSLDEKTVLQLNALNRAHNVTAFMSLQAMLKVLFHCYSGQEDILIGGLVAGRHHAELEPLIGFFCNTVVFRSKLQPLQSFADLLAQVRVTTLDAYTHQDLPIELVLDALDVPRTLSHSPLFQVLLVLQNADGTERPGSAFGALRPQERERMHRIPLQPETGSARRELGTFDLTLNVTQDKDCLDGHWEYNQDLFDRTTMERLHRHFMQLLAQLSAAPETRLQEVARFDHIAPPPGDADGNANDHAPAALRTPTEDALAAIWRELLEIDDVGVFDNFFHAGGSSLLAVRMLHAVKTHFDVRLPLSTIFTAQTVAELALEVNARQAGRDLVVVVDNENCSSGDA